MIVFDASALLAFLFDEPGAEIVAERLDHGGACGAANWSEVAQKVTHAGADWKETRHLLLDYPVSVEPVTERDAEAAAALWRTGSGLSLADRLCLALGQRLHAEIVTADALWEGHGRVTLIR